MKSLKILQIKTQSTLESFQSLVCLKPDLWLEGLQYNQSASSFPVFCRKHELAGLTCPRENFIYQIESHEDVDFNVSLSFKIISKNYTHRVIQSYKLHKDFFRKQHFQLFEPMLTESCLQRGGKRDGLSQRAVPRRKAFLSKNELAIGTFPSFKTPTKLLCQFHDRRPCFMPSQPC